MSPPRTSPLLLSLLSGLGLGVSALASPLPAQDKGGQPVAAPGLQDPGVPVEMFESANLDRFLRRAQDFLADEDYGKAISVLQDIIEGRTGEFMDPDAEKEKEKDKAKAEAEAKKDAKAPQTKRQTGIRAVKTAKAVPQPKLELPIDDNDPAYSVFSSDERIYRPVARLCHELLASMPAEGVGLYRVKYEALAHQAYEKAAADRDLSGLEAVYNQYLATIASAHAMQVATDLLMDAGRFRAAIQTLNTLLEVYPEPSRREAGIRDLLLMVKVAICYQQLGEFDLAAEQLATTNRMFPEASVRLMGELYPVQDLHASELFDVRNLAVTEATAASFTIDLIGASALTPLWEFRYADMRPYATSSKATTQRGSIRAFNANGQVIHGSYFPRLNNHVPGTTVQFAGGSLAFLDNFRPVVHELTSGRQELAMGDPKYETSKVSTSNALPRARIPSYDYFANRVAMDDKRYYAIQGYVQSVSAQASFRAIQENRLAAYDRRTGDEIWSLDSTANRKRPITFLATPTVYRSTLLLPFLDAGSYGLMCVSSADGRELFRTYLHYRGTGFARAPAAPVVVDSGIAYVLTNAGVLSTVDANTGVLHWSRRYERIHERSPRSTKTRTTANMWGRGYVTPLPYSFRGFAPSNLYVVDDLIILAAVDSTLLLCLNGANGEIRWKHDAEKPYHHEVFGEKLTYVVGHNDKYLFVMSGQAQCLCIGIKSGLRYWIANVPGMDYGDWAGRGWVTDDYVVLPGKTGTRRIHVMSANTTKLPDVKTLELPAFSIGKEPLSGPSNLFVGGAYLAQAYEGGVEVYSSAEALAALAKQSETADERATYLVHAGQFAAAAEILFGELAQENLSPVQRRRLSVRALSLVEDVANAAAAAKRRDEALAILDRCEKHMRDPRHVRRVHLFRLNVFRKLGDLEGVEREQEYIESGGVK